MNSKSRFLLVAALALIPPTGLVNAETIAATNFDGQTQSANTASDLNWTLNGVEDPGDLAALNEAGNPQNLFTANALVQNLFIPGINTGNGNTFWTTTVALTVSAGSSVSLSDVTFDYWAVNGGQNQNVNRQSDFTITLRDPSSAVLEAVTIADSLNGTGVSAGAGTPVTATFTTPIALTSPGTYTLEIKGGDFVGFNETGNHTGIDNLSINGPDADDTIAPTPDPMSFAAAPAATGPNSISMTAETATDGSGVEYLFTNTTLATESGWQDSTEWADTGLAAETEYTYTVRARDKSAAQNETAASAPAAATTDPADTLSPTPDPMTFAVPPAAESRFSITMTATPASDPSGVEYLFTNTTLATESGWQDSAEWTDTGLTAGTEYTYTVTARDKSAGQNETAASAPAAATTDATDMNPPTPDPMTFEVVPTQVDNTSISMTATTATDESGVEYLFENLTLFTDSGWQASPTWTDTGLAPNMTYSYTVTARDTSPTQSETLPSDPASVNLVEVIAATSFDGQTISGNTASDLNWILNGVEDPGDMAAFNEAGNPQNLFNGNALVQNLFIPGINTGNGNTFWTTTVALTVSAGSSVTVTEVTFDYWAVNGGQNQNVNRQSDFTITLRDPSSAVLEAVTIADSLNGTGVSAGAGTPVTATFTTPIALTDPGTYTLEIKGGDFIGFNETGNHTAIDNLAIIGAAGKSSALGFNVMSDGANLDLEWKSQPGKFYVLLTNTDLAAELATWESVNVPGSIENNGVFEIATTPPLNMHTIARPGDPERFYRVQEFSIPPPPPLLEETFELVAGPGLPVGWSTSAGVTAWEVGNPAGGAPTGPTAANSAPNCAGTVIGGDHAASTTYSMITPTLAIPVDGAVLSFAQFLDTDEQGDVGTIRILDADNADVLLEVLDPPGDIEGFGAGWTAESIQLPATVNGANIKIEFQFVTNNNAFEFSGIYIDDVVIQPN